MADALTVSARPGVIYPESTGVVIYRHTYGAPSGLSFDSFQAAFAADDTTEREIKAGSVGITYRFYSIVLTTYAGSTKPAATRNLIFTDGSAGTELGRIPIPNDMSTVHDTWAICDPVWQLTAGNGLFAHLDDVLGTSSGFTVAGGFWKTP